MYTLGFSALKQENDPLSAFFFQKIAEEQHKHLVSPL